MRGNVCLFSALNFYSQHVEAKSLKQEGPGYLEVAENMVYGVHRGWSDVYGKLSPYNPIRTAIWTLILHIHSHIDVGGGKNCGRESAQPPLAYAANSQFCCGPKSLTAKGGGREESKSPHKSFFNQSTSIIGGRFPNRKAKQIAGQVAR